MKIRLTLLLGVICLKCLGQGLEIPQGIVYKKTTDSVNNLAKNILAKELSNRHSILLFDKRMYVGPHLWNRYKKMAVFKTFSGGNIQLKIPTLDSLGNKSQEDIVEGKLVQSQNDFLLVWQEIVNHFSEASYVIRHLTKRELLYYWSTIFYDIEEPVFIVENNSLRLLVQFTPDRLKLFWIDEVLF